MPAADRLAIRPTDRRTLRSWMRSDKITVALSQRAQIVLLAGDGVPNTEIAHQVGVSRPTVQLWRRRFADGGISALEDRPRPGRPRVATADSDPKASQPGGPGATPDTAKPTDAPPYRRTSGAEVVHRLLHDRIVSGELAPGQRLYELELAQTLHVSRTPLREAIRMLLGDGLVRQLPTGGTVVAPLDVDDARDLYAVRAVLEGLVARETCERLRAAPDDDIRAELIRLDEQLERFGDYESDVLRLGQEFHRRIQDLAGNKRATLLLEQQQAHIDRYSALATEDAERRHDAVEEHRAVLAALIAGDPDRAEGAMRAHVEGAYDAFRRAASEAEATPDR